MRNSILLSLVLYSAVFIGKASADSNDPTTKKSFNSPEIQTLLGDSFDKYTSMFSGDNAVQTAQSMSADPDTQKEFLSKALPVCLNFINAFEKVLPLLDLDSEYKKDPTIGLMSAMEDHAIAIAIIAGRKEFEPLLDKRAHSNRSFISSNARVAQLFVSWWKADKTRSTPALEKILQEIHDLSQEGADCPAIAVLGIGFIVSTPEGHFRDEVQISFSNAVDNLQKSAKHRLDTEFQISGPRLGKDGEYSTKAEAGKIVVVFVYANEDHSKKTADTVTKLMNSQNSDKVAFVGALTDRDHQTEIIHNFGLDKLTQVQFTLDDLDKLGVEGTPSVFVIDQDGILRAFHTGGDIVSNNLAKDIQKLVK